MWLIFAAISLVAAYVFCGGQEDEGESDGSWDNGRSRTSKRTLGSRRSLRGSPTRSTSSKRRGRSRSLSVDDLVDEEVGRIGSKRSARSDGLRGSPTRSTSSKRRGRSRSLSVDDLVDEEVGRIEKDIERAFGRNRGRSASKSRLDEKSHRRGRGRSSVRSESPASTKSYESTEISAGYEPPESYKLENQGAPSRQRSRSLNPPKSPQSSPAPSQKGEQKVTRQRSRSRARPGRSAKPSDRTAATAAKSSAARAKSQSSKAELKVTCERSRSRSRPRRPQPSDVPAVKSEPLKAELRVARNSGTRSRSRSRNARAKSVAPTINTVKSESKKAELKVTRQGGRRRGLRARRAVEAMEEALDEYRLMESDGGHSAESPDREDSSETYEAPSASPGDKVARFDSPTDEDANDEGRGPSISRGRARTSGRATSSVYSKGRARSRQGREGRAVAKDASSDYQLMS